MNQSRDMEKKHYDVVCAVVRRDNDYLCMQRLRKGPDYVSEHWEFPGGKVKTGESREQALLREIREEMDWEIYVGRQIGQVEQEYPDFTITLTAFDCMARDFDFKLLAHIDCRWLPREQLATLEWTEADRLLIQQLP